MADAMARFKRLCGYDVRFPDGTDEHGQKIETLAKAKGSNASGLCGRSGRRHKEAVEDHGDIL